MPGQSPFWFRRVFACLAVVSVAGCAEPSLRSAVYNSYGPEYAVLDPTLPAPVGKVTSNSFRYVPGFIAIPTERSARDDLRRQAAVWDAQRPRAECGPTTRPFNYQDVLSVPRPPVRIEYVLDSRNLFVPVTTENAREAAKADLRLNDNHLRYVRRVAISISNVSDRHVTPQMLDAATADVMRRCGRHFRGRIGVQQIDGTLSGNVTVELETLEGAGGKLTGKLTGKILRAVSKRSEDQNVFFAVRTRRIN